MTLQNGGYIMIRKSKEEDINRVAEIWLDTNLKAHHFISEQYWRDNFEMVKEMLSQAELYVYEDENTIQGFVGLNEYDIEGIFVWSEAQSKGVVKQLIDFVKGIKRQLRLRVYQKNTRAVSFYQKQDFQIESEYIDENTGEREFSMFWRQSW